MSIFVVAEARYCLLHHCIKYKQNGSLHDSCWWYHTNYWEASEIHTRSICVAPAVGGAPRHANNTGMSFGGQGQVYLFRIEASNVAIVYDYHIADASKSHEIETVCALCA